MKSLAIHKRAALRAPWSFSVLFLAATCLLHADVPGVTGSITSTEAFSRSGFSQSITIGLSAANFSLNAVISSDNLVNFSGAGSSVTFNPKAMTSDVMPLLIAANPGVNHGTLIYNGVSYTNLQIALNFSGASATVANTGPNPEYFFSGNIANIPFTMTGVVSIYAAPPSLEGVEPNPPLFAVNFSGSGLYGATVTGDLPGSGGGWKYG